MKKFTAAFRRSTYGQRLLFVALLGAAAILVPRFIDRLVAVLSY